jgi:hypothetical protein
MVNTDDAALVEAFEAGREPDGGFHHAQHVRVAWYYLQQHPLDEALARFRGMLQQFATAHGMPQLYHETITTAYVLLIRERLDASPDAAWFEFASANADLLQWKPSVLERYYTPETLWSERARGTFVTPDRCQIGVGSGSDPYLAP